MTDDLRARVLEEIERQLALCDSATPAPWFATGKTLPGEDGVAGWNIGDNEYAGGIASAGEYPYYCIDSRADAFFIAASRQRWPAALRFARGEVERHGIDADYPDCYCCETRYPCPTILAAAEAFGVTP